MFLTCPAQAVRSLPKNVELDPRAIESMLHKCLAFFEWPPTTMLPPIEGFWNPHCLEVGIALVLQLT